MKTGMTVRVWGRRLNTKFWVLDSSDVDSSSYDDMSEEDFDDEEYIRTRTPRISENNS
jgi:hypothetical protein